MTKNASGDIMEAYEELREKVEQEIRDTDKQMAKLTKRKAELQEMLTNGQQQQNSQTQTQQTK